MSLTIDRQAIPRARCARPSAWSLNTRPLCPTSAHSSGKDTDPRPDSSRRKLVTIGIVLGMFLSAIDTTIVGTAMPTVIASPGGPELFSWVFAAYMLAATTSTPLFGKLSDLFGQRALFAVGIGLFLLGSALAGGSQTMTQLIVFRAIQGIGGGALPHAVFAALEQSLSNSLTTLFAVSLALLVFGLVVSVFMPNSTPARDMAESEGKKRPGQLTY